jgi:hypothetical protein
MEYADTEDAVVGFRIQTLRLAGDNTVGSTVVRHVENWMAALPNLAQPP